MKNKDVIDELDFLTTFWTDYAGMNQSGQESLSNTAEEILLRMRQLIEGLLHNKKQQTPAPCEYYGWRIVRVTGVNDGAVALDIGMSVGSGCFKYAAPGDSYLVNIKRSPLFGFGEIVEGINLSRRD
jgi:hypothetical protein